MSAVRTVQVQTVEQVRQLLFDQEFQQNIGRYRKTYVYRGLPSADYELQTSLARNCKHRKDELEALLLDNFSKYARMENPSIQNSVWYKMILGQHHGLPTRLLDWSRSPLMALHFATSEDEMDLLDRRDCVVWRLDVEKANLLLPEAYREQCVRYKSPVFTVDMLHGVCDSLADYDSAMGNGSMVMLEPPTIDMRIANQYSFFAIVPSRVTRLEEILEKIPEDGVIRYVIDRNLRWQIRDMLDQANINERIVYPGLDGIATWLKRYYFVRDLTRLRIRTMNVVDLDADIIVNPTDGLLTMGNGAGGDIARKAGPELQEACDRSLEQHGGLSYAPGEVVVTGGYRLKAGYVYHAVTVEWDDSPAAAACLRKLYEGCLAMAEANRCHSIGFPLLMSGFNGCPQETAWRVALETCDAFLAGHGSYPL